MRGAQLNIFYRRVHLQFYLSKVTIHHWCGQRKTQVAEKLVKGDDFTFEIELVRRIGHHLGELTVESQRLAFPLGLTLVREFVNHRFRISWRCSPRNSSNCWSRA